MGGGISNRANCLGRAHTESTRHESTRMSHETHRLSVRGSMDTPMRERRIKWGGGEGETLSIHVESTQCALGLSQQPKRLHCNGKGEHVRKDTSLQMPLGKVLQITSNL